MDFCPRWAATLVMFLGLAGCTELREPQAPDSGLSDEDASAAGGTGGNDSGGDGGGGGSSGTGGTGGRSGLGGTGGTGGDTETDGGVDAGPDVDSRCDALDCGAHGACTIADDEPICECRPGHVGELCAECEEGLQLDGTECVVVPCDGAKAPDCGDNGECSAATGEPICVCEHPFDGPACTDCATGFAKQSDGGCEPDCGECGAHSVCNETLMTPTCECVVGYTRSGSHCEWEGDGTTGGVVDGELDTASAWTSRHAEFAGGSVTFDNAGAGLSCELGSIEQVIDMPAFDDAESFAVEIDISSPCTESNGDLCPPLLLEVDEQVTRLPVAAGSGSQPLTACLGDSGYGENVTLRVMPGIAQGVRTYNQLVQAFSCSSTEWPSVEAVRIVAVEAGLCPRASWITNGSFDSSARWSLTSANISGGALSLQAEGQASTNLVVPSARQMTSPAVQVTLAAGATGSVRVGLDGLLLGHAGATATRICLPDWARGSGHVLRLQSMPGSATSVAEVSVVNEAACGDGALDSGFERSTVDQYPRLGSWEYAGGTPVVDADAAHAGTKGLRLSAAINGLRALTFVPRTEPGALAGPALEYWHKRTSASLQTTVEFLPAASSEYMIGSNAWQRRTDCLPKAWAGQPIVFFGAFGLTGAAAELHVDDIGPVLSSSCN